MSTIRDLLNDLAEFEESPDSAGYDLRLDLADIILRHLDGKDWTQRRLAEAAGMKPPFITRVTHAAQNCTFDVAGRLLFALGVKARLIEDVQATFNQTADSTAVGGDYAQPKIIRQDQTRETTSIRKSDSATSGIVRYSTQGAQ
jgi:plasmid maintenance system antidote protein VapI